jgi:hypothetical protein
VIQAGRSQVQFPVGSLVLQFKIVHGRRHGKIMNYMVKTLCYKPEGRGFDTRWGEFLNVPNPSGRTRPWGLLSL